MKIERGTFYAGSGGITNPLVLGPTGAITLLSTLPSSETATATGNGWQLTNSGGAFTLNCASGFNLFGSGSSQISLANPIGISAPSGVKITGFGVSETTQTGATYTTTGGDSSVLCNPVVSMTVTLTSGFIGKRCTVKNITAAQIVTVQGASGNIDGLATATLTTLQKATFEFDGTNWWIVG
jgi:hypothetical protein